MDFDFNGDINTKGFFGIEINIFSETKKEEIYYKLLKGLKNT